MPSPEKKSHQETEDSLRKMTSLEYVKHLRFDWKDEVPEKMKGSTDKDIQWKVRRGWFQNLGYEIQELIDSDAEIPPYLQKAIDEFETFCKAKDTSELTTPEDIEKGNEFLDVLIRYYEEQEQST